MKQNYQTVERYKTTQNDNRIEASETVKPVFRRMFFLLLFSFAVFIVLGDSFLGDPTYPLDIFRAFALSLGMVNIAMIGAVIYAYNKIRLGLDAKDTVERLLPVYIIYLGIALLTKAVAICLTLIEAWGEKFQVLILPVAVIAFTLSIFGVSRMLIFQQATSIRINAQK